MKYLITLLLMTLSTNLFAVDANGNTICLNMIVKDEKDVIERCLASVLPFIDYWVIVDTGSTDGTQQIIEQFLQDIPGELYERPWKNFGYNRNEALQLAKFKSDYVLFMDADDTLEYPANYKLPALDCDAYQLLIKDAGTQYARTQLIKNTLGWRWRDVLHEYLECTDAYKYGRLENLFYIRNYDGARTKDPEKYLKDIRVLEDALKKDPGNHRYQFYLAESYRSATLYEKAIENYQKRADMGGWEEEIFWCLLQIASLKDALQKSPKEIINAYNNAFQYRPTRVEPLYYLIRYYNKIGQHHAAYAYGNQALSVPYPNDSLFVEKWIYDYGLELEYSVAAYWIEDYAEAQRVSKLLLSNPDAPDYIKDLVIKNLEWINPRLQ